MGRGAQLRAFRLDDDVFIDQIVRSLPAVLAFTWRGQSYQAPIPRGAELPCFLTVEGVADPPEGDLVVVLRRKPGVRDLLGHSGVFQATVRVAR